MTDRTARSGTHRVGRTLSRFWGIGAALLVCLLALAHFSAIGVAAAPNPGATTVLDGAGADRDLGAGPSRDYMTVNLNLTQQSFVRVAFTGYAYAKSSAGGTITPGCPCLVRGELRANQEAKQIVTRTALSTDADDVVGDPAASPAVAAADRRDLSGSHVFTVPAGTHTFVMSLTREVGTAQNVGFAFGRMQADILAGAPTASPSPTPAPSASPTPAPTPAPSVPGMPNTGGGAGASMLPQSWPTIAGVGFLGVALITLIALRRRDI